MVRGGVSPLVLALYSVGCVTAAPPPSEVASAPAPVPSPVSQHEPRPPPKFDWRHEFHQATDAGSFAIVDVGTDLWTSSSTDAARCAFRGLHPGVVRVVGRRDRHVEVELDWELDPRLHHCVRAPLASIGLRMFVVEQELAQVTVNAHTLETGEDTGILVAPGVLVREHGAGLSRYRMLYSTFGNPTRIPWTTADRFVVRLDDELPSLGRVYSPMRTSSLRKAMSEPAAFKLSERWDAHAVDYGAGEVGVRGEVFAQSPRDPNLVVVGSECVQVAGRIRGAQAEGVAGMSAALADPNATSWVIAAGTPLTWKSGGAAGMLHHELRLTRPPRRHRRRSCFTPPLPCDGHEGLDVCVASDSVVVVPPSSEP